MLRRLSVHGFKSFCDRTEVVLGRGITAIVGPNGCGKSNLADALRWVLGEQNPRTLRSPRSQDIIFSGTQSRKAMGMAEVKLLFDSVDNGKETEIARRLTRDGSGEYRLNGRSCRWKDVVETLAGTGLSHTGYVVIGQGTIQELASGRPEDRRVWIEEASGVARVRLDKRDIETRLQAARSDMARLDDLLVELVARRASLETDRESARQYQALAKRRQDLDLSMWLSSFDEESRKLSTMMRRVERYRTELREAEVSLSRLREEECELQKSREPLSARLVSLSREREHAVQELLSLEKKRDSVEGQALVLRREVEARTARRGAIVRDLGNLAKEEDQLRERRDKTASEYQDAAGRLKESEEKRQSCEAERRSLSEKIIGVRAEVVALTGELGSVQRVKEDLRRRLDEVGKERSALQDYLQEASLDKSRQVREIRTLDGQQAAAEDRSEEARRSLESLESRSGAVKELLGREILNEKNLGARLSAAKARRKLLEDMEANFEGYGKGPRTVLEARQRGRLQGVEGSVGQLLSCEPRYIQALSAALGGAAENIVVTDEDAAKRAIGYLKETRGGRATFLPVPVLRPREMPRGVQEALARAKGARPLLMVVTYPKDLEVAARYLVGRVVLADTMDIGLAFMRESGWGTRVVTLTGESIEPGGAISGGEAPRSESLFRRKQELAEVRETDVSLSRDMEVVLVRRKSLEKEAASLAEDTAKARSEMVQAGADVSRLAEARARAGSQVKALESQVREREAQLPVLLDREMKLSREMDASSTREQEIALEMAMREADLKRYDVAMGQAQERDKDSEREIRHLLANKEELEQDLSSIVRRMEGLVGEKTTHERSLAEEDKEIARQGTVLRDAEAEGRTLGERITALEGLVSSLVSEIERSESERGELTSRLSSVVGEIERLERDSALMAGRAGETTEEIEAVKKTLGETTDLIDQEFGIGDPGESDHPRVSRAEGLREAEELDGQLKALGSVNLKAEEEWSELSDRIDLITQEKADVEDAIAEINRAREMVEREIEARFIHTFGLVAASFREIFQELFGGGRGDLTLIDDTLGVEVTAEPPGRRQKHLNLLSGGERSLCGIALIFAILSVKASPFIVLDEADTALDESNIVRFSQFLKRYAEDTQFLVITHQKATMEAADLLYGVTMEEPGVSKVFGMRLEKSQ